MATRRSFSESMVQHHSHYTSSRPYRTCMCSHQRRLGQSYERPHQYGVRPSTSGRYSVPLRHFSHYGHRRSHDDEVKIQSTTFRFGPRPNFHCYNHSSYQNYLCHGASIFDHPAKSEPQYLGVSRLTAHPGLSRSINLHHLWTHFETNSTSTNRTRVCWRGRRTFSNPPAVPIGH